MEHKCTKGSQYLDSRKAAGSDTSLFTGNVGKVDEAMLATGGFENLLPVPPNIILKKLFGKVTTAQCALFYFKLHQIPKVAHHSLQRHIDVCEVRLISEESKQKHKDDLR